MIIFLHKKRGKLCAYLEYKELRKKILNIASMDTDERL
jgi:hypothetical protein